MLPTPPPGGGARVGRTSVLPSLNGDSNAGTSLRTGLTRTVEPGGPRAALHSKGVDRRTCYKAEDLWKVSDKVVVPSRLTRQLLLKDVNPTRKIKNPPSQSWFSTVVHETSHHPTLPAGRGVGLGCRRALYEPNRRKLGEGTSQDRTLRTLESTRKRSTKTKVHTCLNGR